MTCERRSRGSRPPIARRTFLGAILASATTAAASGSDLNQRICLFTDHLSGIPVPDVARMLAELKVSGPDLTVRPGGLVAPETATTDLPRAAALFKDHGMRIPMITTAITSVDNGRALLEVAARTGIPYYKLGYFQYDDMERWREKRAEVASNLGPLVELGKSLGIRAGFHTHSGPIVGRPCVGCTRTAVAL